MPHCSIYCAHNASLQCSSSVALCTVLTPFKPLQQARAFFLMLMPVCGGVFTWTFLLNIQTVLRTKTRFRQSICCLLLWGTAMSDASLKAMLAWWYCDLLNDACIFRHYTVSSQTRACYALTDASIIHAALQVSTSHQRPCALQHSTLAHKCVGGFKGLGQISIHAQFPDDDIEGRRRRGDGGRWREEGE